MFIAHHNYTTVILIVIVVVIIAALAFDILSVVGVDRARGL